MIVLFIYLANSDVREQPQNSLEFVKIAVIASFHVNPFTILAYFICILLPTPRLLRRAANSRVPSHETPHGSHPSTLGVPTRAGLLLLHLLLLQQLLYSQKEKKERGAHSHLCPQPIANWENHQDSLLFLLCRGTLEDRA